MRKPLLLLSVWLLSCEGANTPAKCSDATLAELETKRVAEVVAVCAGNTVDTCPEYAEIDAKYEALRKDWVECQ